MNNLDYSRDQFSQLLDHGRDLVLDRFDGLDTAPAFSGATPDEVRSWFEENLPTSGMDPHDVLSLVKEKVLDTATLNMGPNMFAYVMAGGTQISIIAEMLAATINQNVGKWHLAPSITELERQVVKWGAQFLGYDDSAGGVLVSGGSAANLTALTVARNVFMEQDGIRKKGLFQQKPLIVYASEEVHGCVDKSVELLGIGSDNLRKIATHDDYTIRMDELIDTIKADLAAGLRPFCLVGNAGTVNTGAIDPLMELSEVAEKHKMWFHVDGAYGGLAAATVPELFGGLERAHSMALDFHKWLYQPFEAGCTLVRNWSMLKNSFFKKASYLSTDTTADGRFDFNDHHFQLSRNAKALKIWMSFKAYGRDQLVQMIQKDIDLTKYLADQIDSAPDFERCNDPQLGVVCFRYLGKEGLIQDPQQVDQVNRDIIPALEKDRRVFITGTTLKDRPVIRACLVNHRLQQNNIDHLIRVMREVGETIDVQ